jgi:hypothetical protein
MKTGKRIYRPYDRNNHHRQFPEYSRQDYRDMDLRPYQRLYLVHGDELALRQLILRTEVRQTLVNCILGSHNRPNRY